MRTSAARNRLLSRSPLTICTLALVDFEVAPNVLIHSAVSTPSRMASAYIAVLMSTPNVPTKSASSHRAELVLAPYAVTFKDSV